MSAASSLPPLDANEATLPSPTPSSHLPTPGSSSELEEGEVGHETPGPLVKRFWSPIWNRIVHDLSGAHEDLHCTCDVCHNPFEGDHFFALSDLRVLCLSCWVKGWVRIPDIKGPLPLDLLHFISLAQVPITAVENVVFSELFSDRNIVSIDLLKEAEAIFGRWQEKTEGDKKKAFREFGEVLAKREERVIIATDIYDAARRAFTRLTIPETQVDPSPVAPRLLLLHPFLPPISADDLTTFYCNGCPASFTGPEMFSHILSYHRVRDLFTTADLKSVFHSVKVPPGCKVEQMRPFLGWLMDNWPERGVWVHDLLTDPDTWADYAKHAFLVRGVQGHHNEAAIGPASGAVCRDCAYAIFVTEIFNWWKRNHWTSSGYSSGYASDGEDGALANAAASGALAVENTESSDEESEAEHVQGVDPVLNEVMEPDAGGLEDPLVAAAEVDAQTGYAAGDDDSQSSSTVGTVAQSDLGVTSPESSDWDEFVIAVMGNSP